MSADLAAPSSDSDMLTPDAALRTIDLAPLVDLPAHGDLERTDQ